MKGLWLDVKPGEGWGVEVCCEQWVNTHLQYACMVPLLSVSLISVE